MTGYHRLLWTTLGTIALVLGGCNRASVSVYDVPKEQPAATNQTAPTTQSRGTAEGGVGWSKPAAWTELAPTAFRKGNYVVEGDNGAKVEITVSSFPGTVGGILANVNRWRGQAALSPISEGALQQSLSDVSVDGQNGQLVDILPESEDPTATRIVAAIFLFEGNSWFFKMSGPQNIVATQRNAFNSFIKSIRFAGSAPSEPVSAKPTPAKDAPLELAFDAPEGWTQSSGSSLRLASYEIVKEGFPSADFSITSFPGDAGGLTANINRWRKQIGLTTWNETQIDRNKEVIHAGELVFAVFDLMPSTDAEKSKVKERILAAILRSSDRSWFFKLRGDVFLLDTQKSKFRQLILSVHFESPTENANR